MTKHSKLFYTLAWLVAIVATAGSLILSEVLLLPPCSLCWYQRILMYPLVIILGVGIYRKNAELHMYALPFTILGGLIALYHSFLQWGIFKTSDVCTSPTSCTSVSVNLLGFITIPFMSLVAFLLITGLIILAVKGGKR